MAEALDVLAQNPEAADHPDTLTMRNNLASWLGRKGDVARAIAEYERLLEDCIRVLGEDHPNTRAVCKLLELWPAEEDDG